MKITIVENKEHGFANLKFSDKPDYVKDKALLDELKANGWGYSKYNGVWYPRTNEAKNKANDFAKEIIVKYSEPEKSFGQELFERSQRIDEWKKNNLNVEKGNPVQASSQDHSTNEPVTQPVQNIELNDKQKQVLDLLKSTGNLSESQMLEIVSKIDQAYQTENFESAQKRIPKELSWEELKEFIHADDSFDLSKDLRELYHPNESETYQKILATYNHFHDVMNWDVLRETAYERIADSEFHNSMESIRKNILWDTCEKTVNGFFNTFEDFQKYFKTLRDNEIYNISKNYMENPEIKAMYKEMKRAELSERVPDILQGREFSSWLIPNPEQDGAFLFYERNGYLKSEYLNQNKYESVKNFLTEVESDELLTDSAKQLKTEYAKMHGLLKTPAEEIKEDIEADKLDDLMTELVEEELYQNNQLEIESIESDESNENTTSKWLNEEDLEYVEYPGNKEKTEEKSIELTEEDLEYAQKVIPEEQYMDMLQYANGEEAEHFKAKLKNAANIARELMNRKSSKELVNADGSHPCKLHYFIGGCDWYISELDKDGVGFGYAILNNDLTFSEWGSVNVCSDSTYEQPLTKMSVSVPVEINGREFRNNLTPQLDLYLDEDTTIERELFKRDNEFFNEYEKYAKIEKKNEKELAKSSEVSINIIEETNQDLEAQYGSEIDNGLVGRADSSSGSNLTQELEGQGESRNRGDNSGEGQRVLSGEREGNSELGHTEGVPGIEQSRPESRFNNIPGKEGLSSGNETLLSEVGIGESNSDMQSAGMADNSTLHRSSSEQSELRVGVNQNTITSSDPVPGTEEVIEQEADNYFNEVTKRYSTQYAEFFKSYDEVKESHLENETRYVGDARIYSLFENTHKELVNLQFEELTDIIKNASNLEISKKAATRYFNFAGQDEFNYLHDNLFLRCHLGDYVRNELGTTSFVAPKPEELQNFITETFNSLHGITQEADDIENTPVDDKEYAENLADWIIQHGMNESTEMENYSVSFEDILENTDTTEEWLNAHIDLVNDALAVHNDNELLEYNPDENELKEFNLYFCSNSDEMGENTLFKQNEEGRWIRKSEEELQREKLEVNKTPDVPTKENVQKKMFILDKLHAAGIEVVTDKEEFERILESQNILQKMETSSTEEKNPLFLADEKELKAFAQKVDDWKAGKLASTEVISEFSTSTVLQAINIPANKVSVTQDVLHKINELETVKVGKSYGHDIDIATIKKIPEFLADPVMVFASASTPGSYVIMSETIDKKNRTIMVAMEINKQNANVIVNNITSAYGRNDNNFFIEQIKLGNLVYQNKQKSLEWTNERGLPLPPQMSTQGSLNVIQKEDIVNQKTPNFSFSERRLAFTENQQEFLRELGFTNSVDGDNSVLDWKLSKTIPETNKIIYFEIGADRGSGNCFSCYEIDESKDNIVRTDLLRRYAEEKNAFEGFLTSISFNDRQNNFIVPYEKLGKVLSDEILEKLTDYIDDKAPKISRENFSNDIIDVAFKNKVRNLPAKFISEDIYSSGIKPIGKELTFKVYKEVLKIAGVPVDDKKHYLLKIQTDNNYEYVHNKDYPRLYEAKWNRIKQVYTDEVELNLNSFNSKTIGNIQYIAANNCNYPNPPAQTMTLSDGKTYGFAYEGKIYLNPDIWNSEVAVHEYTHLWDNYIQRTNPELWEKGKQIFRNTRFWNEVKNDPNYADIADNNDLILSEVHARICGEMADKVLNKILEQEGKITADKVINWDNETWEYLLSDLGITEFPITQSSDITFDEIRDFLSAPMKDLMNGLRITQNMNIDNSPKPDNPQHTLSWEELELDPNDYDSYGEVPSDETEFKEWALGLQLENELDLRGFDTGLENVLNEDNSRISEQKWAILDDLSHRIVYGELKYEPHNYDYSNQQKEYDRLLKENPVFQELTSNGVIKADFENPFVVPAEKKKEPLAMLKAEDVKFSRESKDQMYSYDGIDGTWYITDKVIDINSNIVTYQLAFKPKPEERTFSSEMARNNWLGITEIPSNNFVTKNKKEYYIFDNDKETFRIKEKTGYIPFGNIFRNSKACRDEAVNWVLQEENTKRTEYNNNLEKEPVNELYSNLAANISWSEFTEDAFNKTKADMINGHDGEMYGAINVGQLSFELVPQDMGDDGMDLFTNIYYPKLYATYGEDADGVKYDTASGFDIDAETFTKMSYEEFKDYFVNTVLPSSLDKDLTERALQPTEDWNTIWEKLNKENNYSYMFPEGFFKNSKELNKYEVEYEGTFDFESDGTCQVISGDKKTLEKIAADYGYELHPDYLYHKDDLNLDDRTAVHDMAFRSVDLADAFKSENVEVIKNPDEIQNTISKLETIIKETYLTIPEGEESLTHDELQRRYNKWTRPLAREILEELKNGNQNIIKLINDFDLNKETHLKEGTYGTAEQRFKYDVQYELMPALYKEVQNKIIEKYDENKTPYVILEYSESPAFPTDGKVYALKEFNEILTQADKEFHNRKEYAEKKYGSADNYWRLEDAGKLPEEDKGITFGYDKTEFKLCNIPNLENPEDTYSYEASRYDIGDGDGSVFDFIRTTCSHDVLIESCNKLEREMYYPEIKESQRVFVENAAKEEAALLKQNLVEKMEALDNAQQEYTELHKKWLIESSEAERIDEQINKALADIKATYDNSISNLYTKVLNEYPFASKENISDSQFMLYTANEAKKMVLSELYLPSLESAKDYSKYNANDWDKFRKIFKQFPAKVNMTEYVENILQEKCNEKGYSVSENIAQEERPVEQLTSKKDIKAIREQCREILQKSDSEITEADKAILAQYEGAGGIKEENRTAAGVLNEFYTPNNLVEKVWQIVDAYAPEAKTVLEPSAGVGKFANNRPNNEFTMHELDETSARINKILHPEAKIIQGAYQKQFFDAGGRIHMPGQKEHYDVVIGNPPYGLYNDKYKGLGEGKEFDRYEEYFIDKGLDALKDENSIMAFVVPSGFLNTASDKQKEIIAAKGRLIDAYRLPVGTFPTTEVGTDIIIMQSWEKERKEIKKSIDNDNFYTTIIPDADKRAKNRLKAEQKGHAELISNGAWFKQHPEKILGEVKQKTNRFGKLEDVVVVHEGLTVQDELNKIDNFVEGINNSRKLRTYSVLNKDKINELTEVTQEDAPAQVQPEQTQSVSDQSETVAEEIDDPSKRLYEDPDGVFKTNHKLTRQEFAQFYTGANFTSEDYNIWGATDWKGIVDLSKLTAAEQNFLKTSENYVEIADGVYTNAMLYATGNIYEKLDALEEEKESLSEASYNRAKQILENAIPKIVPIEQIKMDALSPLADEFKVSREVTSSNWYLGSSHLNTSVQSINLREDFINWATNCSSLDNFDEKNQPVNTRRAIYNYSTTKIAREDIPEDISWTDIVNYIDKIPVPTHINEKEDTKEVKNKKNLIAGNIKDARKNTCYTLFNRYLQEGLPQEDKERLQTTWNKIYNATVHADYKKLPLFIEGMNTFKGNNPFMLYKQQVEGVSRLLSKGNGLLAYEVGVGKTAAGIVTTMGQLQLGRCKRPLIIVPNQVYKKWVNDFRQLFPDVKINELYNLSEKYISHNYDEKTHSLVIEPNTVTVITDSALQKITFSDKACQTELAEDFGYLLGLSEAINSGDNKIRAEAYQKIMKEVGQASRIQVKKLPEGREQEIQQSYIFFDECGFDNVVIDEAHRYKNLFTVPRPKRGEKTSNEFQGLGTGKPSIRAEKVFGITTLIQRHNEDRNVFLLTATPFTNNPLEVYSMLSYMGRKELINRHIYDVRDFCTEFAQTKFEYAVKPSGDIEPKQVMKNFRGQKKLKNLVFEYIDPVTAEEAGIARPEGARHPIYLELSPLQDRIIKLEQETITKSDNPYVMLKAMTTMRTCTLSPALLDPDDFAGVEDIVIPPKSQIVESSPKLSWVCNTCADLYKQKPECGQFIYMPQGKDCFDEVKEYLIRQGIPEEAIDYIHSTHNGSAEDKDKISARFNDVNDKLKILIGTATVAEGIDLNGNSIVEYNTMLGWNPTESIQVEGRIWRQGNLQGKVHIMYPLMENSIDALIYQKHDEKAHRINSVLSKSDDGNDVIDTDEINPETIKFDLITDPTKKVKMIINEKTAEKRKEMKVIDNRIETLQELENDRQNSKGIYDLNVAEKEKYKTLLKTCREELKYDPENWQKQARVEANERNVEVCNKEIAKAKNRLSTISYNFNKFDIHDPEREVPIKLQELVTKKAELEADVEDIVNSEARLVAEEQKKLLEKKMLSKPVEQLRKEWVEFVLKDTWYKETTDKSKDSSKTVQKPLEAVKDFKVPEEMLKKFDKAMSEMDFKVLNSYLNGGDRDIISDYHENDKAIEILRKRYEKTKGVTLPEQFRKITDYLVLHCDKKTLPPECKFTTPEEAIALAVKNWDGEAYQRDGYVEYVTLDKFKKNRNVSELAKDLQKHEGQSYLGYGGGTFGYECSPKNVKIECFMNFERIKFTVPWSEIAKVKAKQWNKEYPLESSIKVDEEELKKISTAKVEQLDLFGFEELKQQARNLDVRYGKVQSPDLLKADSLKKYKGLPPFIKKSDDVWVIRCKGKDFAITNNFYKDDIVDVSITKQQLRTMVKAHLDNEAKIIQQMKFDNPGFEGKVKTPKPEVGDVQKALLMENGISELNVKAETKKMFNELLCDDENPILKKKEKPLPQRKQTPIQNKPNLIPGNQAKTPVQVEIIETDFDYEY